jgi:hypothetical protein
MYRSRMKAKMPVTMPPSPSTETNVELSCMRFTSSDISRYSMS